MWWLSAAALAGPSTVLVGIEGEPPDLGALGGAWAACFRSSRVCVARGVDPEQVARLPGVRYAELDRPMSLAAGPAITSTPQCPDPHELEQISVEAAWDLVRGVDAPVVAVQDSGFRASHTDLAGRVVGGWDYGDGDGVPEVTWSSGVPEHGTFVSGIVAANDDAVGRTGVAPEAGLFLQKIADRNGALYFSYAIAAMDDLATGHAEVGVLNYSIASLDPPQAFEDAVAALQAADVLVVTAAANCPYPSCSDADNDRFPVYPASYDLPHVVAVASLRPDGTLDPYSHYGATSVALAAPGADVCSLGVANDDQWLVASGTSYATPVVAGVAALVREAWPRLSAPEVARVLCGSADPTPALAGKVACGAVRADVAVDTPVGVLTDVPDLVVDGQGTWVLSLDSRAAAGEVEVVLELPPELVTIGEKVRVIAILPADGPSTLELPVYATGTGTGQGTVRLGSPASDPTTFTFSVSATLPGVDPPEVGEDTGEPLGDDVSGDEAGGGCGCGTPAGTGPGWALWLVGAAVARRRVASR